MREIKFRAWDESFEKMYEVASIDFIKGGCHYRENDDGTWDCACKSHLLQFREFEFAKLMQFTGLLDKNGKEIYEGDIVRCYTLDSSSWIDKEVFWDNDNGCWRIFRGLNLEIIGNIYENQELLNRHC